MVIKCTDTNRFQALDLAADAINRGGIVAYQTETFYGLGVRFDLEESLRRLYEIKHRPQEKAMPLIIGSVDLLPVVTSSVNTTALSLIDRFWPGPLTLVFHAKEGLSDFITAGTGKVAVRVPGTSFALDLARLIDLPVTATSANPSGRNPAQNAATVIRYFGEEIGLVVDCGPAAGGLPSTIADVSGDEIRIVRKGAIGNHLLTP